MEIYIYIYHGPNHQYNGPNHQPDVNMIRYIDGLAVYIYLC